MYKNEINELDGKPSTEQTGESIGLFSMFWLTAVHIDTINVFDGFTLYRHAHELCNCVLSVWLIPV